MVVYIKLEIIRVGPPQKAWVQAWELEPISLTDWNFFELISHYATQGPGQHLLPGLEEATSDDKSPVLVFILTVNNDWSQIQVAQHNILR